MIDVRRRAPSTVPGDLILPGAGIRLHGLDWGGPADGPLVLLLHGVAGNAWIWDAVAPRLRRQLPGHRIVAIDQREGGDTEHPPRGYTREDFAGDVLAAHRALSDRPMVLVGQSRGAWLAAGIAGEHPDLVERLVLIDPARLVHASRGDADRFYTWVSGSLGPFASERAALRWARMTDRLARHTRVRQRSFLFGLQGDGDGRLIGKLPREVVPQLRDARAGGQAVTEALARIVAPALLLLAMRQSAARIADKQAYVDRLPRARVVRVDATHYLHTDRPALVAREIAAFADPTRR